MYLLLPHLLAACVVAVEPFGFVFYRLTLQYSVLGDIQKPSAIVFNFHESEYVVAIRVLSSGSFNKTNCDYPLLAHHDLGLRVGKPYILLIAASNRTKLYYYEIRLARSFPKDDVLVFLAFCSYGRFSGIRLLVPEISTQIFFRISLAQQKSNYPGGIKVCCLAHFNVFGILEYPYSPASPAGLWKMEVCAHGASIKPPRLYAVSYRKLHCFLAR